MKSKIKKILILIVLLLVGLFIVEYIVIHNRLGAGHKSKLIQTKPNPVRVL